MHEITISIPDRLRLTMERYPEVRWDDVVRRLLSRVVSDLDAMERIASGSVLKAKDVDELDHLLKAALLRKYRRRSKNP